MSMAEIFLMVWAGLATTLAVLYRNSAKNYSMAHKMVAILLAEVATGEVKATQDSKGLWTVENDDMRMQFRRKGE